MNAALEKTIQNFISKSEIYIALVIEIGFPITISSTENLVRIENIQKKPYGCQMPHSHLFDYLLVNLHCGVFLCTAQ